MFSSALSRFLFYLFSISHRCARRITLKITEITRFETYFPLYPDAALPKMNTFKPVSKTIYFSSLRSETIRTPSTFSIASRTSFVFALNSTVNL